MSDKLTALECIQRWENNGGRLLVRWCSPVVHSRRTQKRAVRFSDPWIGERQNEQASCERSE